MAGNLTDAGGVGSSTQGKAVFPRRTVAVLVPAAGSGVRMGGTAKPFIELGGRPVLEWALAPFLDRTDVIEVVVALDGPKEVKRTLKIDRRLRTVQGGESRFDSVANAYRGLNSQADIIAVHDGARPFPPKRCIDECIRMAGQGFGVVPGIRAVDTVKRTDKRGRVRETPPRETLWYAQTPQVFPRADFERALDHCVAQGVTPTDDAAMLELQGLEVRMVPSSPVNLKLTTPGDVAVAEAYLARAEK